MLLLKLRPNNGHNIKQNMKNTKQLIAVLVGLLLCDSVFAQNAARTMRFLPFLSGYNVLVPTNSTVTLGQTNVLYTMYNGQIVYSLTNTVVNGTLNTNSTSGDAFKFITLMADVNGDINANAALVITIGQTNLIPIAITNSVGQWFVPGGGLITNYSTGAWAVNWPLTPSGVPNWMSPATTNIYPGFAAGATTNVVNVTLYRGPTMKMGGGGGLGPDLAAGVPIWETAAEWSTNVTQIGVTATTKIYNLPTVFLQGAHNVYVSLTQSNTASQNATGALVNQIGILQPQ